MVVCYVALDNQTSWRCHITRGVPCSGNKVAVTAISIIISPGGDHKYFILTFSLFQQSASMLAPAVVQNLHAELSINLVSRIYGTFWHGTWCAWGSWASLDHLQLLPCPDLPLLAKVILSSIPGRNGLSQNIACGCPELFQCCLSVSFPHCFFPACHSL